MQARVVLVTGASSGIGRACVEHLHLRGYRVFGASRRCPDATLPVESFQLDVRNTDSVGSVIDAVLSRAGRLDALVNVAGISLSGALELHSDQEAMSVIDTNLLGTFRLCRAVLPQMRQQSYGRIVNVSSLAGRIALPFSSLYSASKFAVEGLSESLRLEVRPWGITVSTLEPGDFLTPMSEKYALTRATVDDQVYATRASRAIAIMEADCRKCQELKPIVTRLESILAARHPRIRYSVGMFHQRLALLVHRLVPNSWFEAILRATYQLT